MIKYLFAGDNRDMPNWGCRATSIALIMQLEQKGEIIGSIDKKQMGGRKLERGDYLSSDPVRNRGLLEKDQELVNLIKEADILVINGEGSGIFTTPPRRDFTFQLSLIELAHYLGTPVEYINAMLSDCPVGGRNKITFKRAGRTLKKCRVVSLRDSLSYQTALQMGIKHAEYKPDAVFSWLNYDSDTLNRIKELDNRRKGKKEITLPEQPYVLLGGSSLSAWNPKKAVIPYKRLYGRFQAELGMPIVIIQACRGDEFLLKLPGVKVPVEIGIDQALPLLSQASLLVSGRYHPSIMAMLGGTPCVFLGSNSHKLESLQEDLKIPVTKFSANPTENEAFRITKMAIYLLKKEETHRQVNKRRVKGII